MARHYDAGEYINIVKKLKSEIPSIALSTDIIVGFPGETDKDFEESIRVAKECGFMKIHVFPYSMREGTPAAQRTDQISDEVKAARAKELRDLSDKLAVADFKNRAGSIEDVLVENKSQGRSESYHLLDLPEGFTPGDLIKVQL